jgi:uncharacterized protein DUF5681
MDDDEPVGYRNPPRDTRFQKGKSGNPKGRPPKKSLTEARAFEQACNKKMWVIENGKRKLLTMRQIIDKRLIQKAAEGDPKAMQMFYNQDERISKRKELEPDLEKLPTNPPVVEIVFLDPVDRMKLEAPESGGSMTSEGQEDEVDASKTQHQ